MLKAICDYLSHLFSAAAVIKQVPEDEGANTTIANDFWPQDQPGRDADIFPEHGAETIGLSEDDPMRGTWDTTSIFSNHGVGGDWP